MPIERHVTHSKATAAVMPDSVNPLVSICIPTYNGEQYIEQALLSAFAQTYRPLEIIISDDASSDNTLAIIRRLVGKTDIPIRIHHHNPSGIGANWNHCVEQSQGDFIKFLFQDDLLEPACIETMLELCRTDDEIGLVFSKRNLKLDTIDPFYENWVKKFSDLQSGWTEIERIQDGRKLLRDPNFLSQPRNKVGEPTTVLLRKSVFNKIGFFNTNLKQSLDYEFWYRVFSAFKVGYIDTPLATFRLHETQTTKKNTKQTISDYDDYPQLVYQNLFWHLHPRIQKALFLKYHPAGRLWARVLGNKTDFF